jgi:hypothetical protein
MAAIAALAWHAPIRIRIEPIAASPDSPRSESTPDRLRRAPAGFTEGPTTTAPAIPEPSDQPPALIDLPWLSSLAPPDDRDGLAGLLAIGSSARRLGVPPVMPKPEASIDPPPPTRTDPSIVRTRAETEPSGLPPAKSPGPSTASAFPPPSTPAELLAVPIPDLSHVFSGPAAAIAHPASSAAAVPAPAPPSPAPVATPPLSAPEPPRPEAVAAQPGPPADLDRSPAPSPEGLVPANLVTDDQVEPAGCAACGGFHSLADGPVFHDQMGCAGGQCIPGRQPCDLPFPECDNVVAAAINNLYQCLCCPDPCYQPRWEPAANASFFADYARPRTVTRLRYDNLENLVRPDRNQFWLMQVQPTHSNNRKITDLRARLQQVYIYQEAASERGSFFIEYPYRQLNPSWEPTQAGFGDMNFGIKSLFFDCELLQMTFQFRTYAPTGNSTLNLGTGHFSLDPSILTAIKLGPDTYLQGQYGNWIPLGGNSKLAGGVFYWLTSLNQVLWYVTPTSPLTATLELDGWSFENGGYTSALRPGMTSHYVEKGGGVSYFNIGPGLRQSVCDRLDFGGALTWATSSVHWAQPWFRFEVRLLF